MRPGLSAHLRALEHESIYVLREAAAQFDRAVLLFSGGKDSAVLTWLAREAFAPAAIPFALLHIDTGHNFDETLEFRDRFAERMRCRLEVRYVQDSINRGLVVDEVGPARSRNALQTVTLLEALKELRCDAAIGGARRDEEKARAKERVFSHRDSLGQWDPRNQRPELWRLYNGRQHPGEHFRVFPLSNWTELDVWDYIACEQIPIPPLYLAHRRAVVVRDGQLLPVTPFLDIRPNDIVTERLVRFRTVGDASCTGAVESTATTVASVLAETSQFRIAERGGRFDDQRSESAMEDRKRQGYF